MPDLRPFQKAAIEALQVPQHVICVAPTGSGKTRIIEEWIRQNKGKALLITPLIALARQQYSSFFEKGFRVKIATGGRSELPDADTEIWITSPEALQFMSRVSTLKRWHPGMLVVDECHCLWDWGHDFRPAFDQIPNLIFQFNIPRSLWLTATLPRLARSALRKRLPTPVVEIGAFSLPPGFRLTIQQLESADRHEALARWLQVQEEPGIIFVPTRATTQRIANLAAHFEKRAVIYHAGLSSEERINTEKLIKNQSIDVIVATSAFGMGMDYRYLQWVVLWQAPASLLSFTQAIGRAGRDPSRPGQALVLWSPEDFRLLQNRAPERPAASARYFRELTQTIQFLESRECRSIALARHFQDQALTAPCGHCDICQI